MFIGHFAVGLGAKKYVPAINLGLLFFACQFLDLLWPVLVLLGVENVTVDYDATVVTPLNFSQYPYSHSLVMTILFSLAIGGGIYKYLHSKKAGFVLALVVFSHWFLDYLTHRPDLPVMFDGPMVGLGMWNSLFLTLVVEGAMFAGGIWMYLKVRASASRKQIIGFWVLVTFLVLVYAGNIFGPRPPLDASATMIAGPALAMWLIVIWGYFVDQKTT